MKKVFSVILVLALALSLFAGCAANPDGGDNNVTPAASFNTDKDITVISREDGSGTRGAFIELFGIEQKDASGTKVDMTVETADITNSTGVMKTSVSGNEYAIGYISLGSLDNSVKALKIDGVEATVDNVSNGTYKVARPFNIATLGDVSEVAADFMAFIMSADGQAVIEAAGYIPVSDAPAYSGTKPSGSVAVAGSSSVSPVMEKLKEAYLAINPNAEIEINTSDSTTGMNSVVDGVCDIGMASRELKESELGAGLDATVIAMDGIAVIVNNANTLEGLTSEQVLSIYTGAVATWAEVA